MNETFLILNWNLDWNYYQANVLFHHWIQLKKKKKIRMDLTVAEKKDFLYYHRKRSLEAGILRLQRWFPVF